MFLVNLGCGHRREGSVTLPVGCSWEGWAKLCIWGRRGCTPPRRDLLVFQRWVGRLWDLPVCKRKGSLGWCASQSWNGDPGLPFRFQGSPHPNQSLSHTCQVRGLLIWPSPANGTEPQRDSSLLSEPPCEVGVGTTRVQKAGSPKPQDREGKVPSQPRQAPRASPPRPQRGLGQTACLPVTWRSSVGLTRLRRQRGDC